MPHLFDMKDIAVLHKPSATHVSKKITLGLLSAPHLGDTICTTSLPRLLQQHYGWKVCVIDHPTTRVMFANNPYVKIVSDKRFVRMNRRMRGDGHVIQRLCRGFGLPVSEHPKGELYLTQQERSWACDQRAKLDADKPVCIISTRAITDAPRFRSFHWEALAETLSQSHTLVQPILTDRKSVV